MFNWTIKLSNGENLLRNIQIQNFPQEGSPESCQIKFFVEKKNETRTHHRGPENRAHNRKSFYASASIGFGDISRQLAGDESSISIDLIFLRKKAMM